MSDSPARLWLAKKKKLSHPNASVGCPPIDFQQFSDSRLIPDKNFGDSGMTGYFLDALGPVNYRTTAGKDMEPQPFVSLNADAARLLMILAGVLAGGVVVAVAAAAISTLAVLQRWKRHRSFSHSPSLHWVAVIVCLISLPA